ncbi:acyltransferase [Acidobacterium sp.]|uniref:acyltransferase family protein n=1 Tax=Acidobacterium sp. TaxID=1872119 RepID=UPI00257B6063|nr:acyltransferase [Acidobacterium sp.]
MPAVIEELRTAPGALHYETRTHIGALDGIRGLAVLMVFADHYGNLDAYSHSTMVMLAEHLKSTGWMGVDLFFVLSGFLITNILWRTRQQTHRARNFYMKRILRLFPVYYGVWIFLLLYSAITATGWEPRVFLEYLFYAGNYAAPTHLRIGPFMIDHFWSLAVEEQFYLIWPLVLWNIRRMDTALRLLAAMFGLSALIKLVCLFVDPKIHAYYYLPTHMEPLAAGAFVALAYMKWPDACQRAARAGLVLTVPALVIAFNYFHGLADTSLRVLTVALPLVAIAGVSLLLRSLDSRAFLAKLMNLRVLRFYGKISYGLYVYHYLLQIPLKQVLYVPIHHVLKSHLLAGVAYFALALAVCTLIATLSLQFYEKPFLRMKRRFEEPAGPAQEQAA